MEQHETAGLTILLEECDTELTVLQHRLSNVTDNHHSEEEIRETESACGATNEMEPETINESNEKNSHLQQKANLREQIASLENEIMSLVDQDRFEEADELEQENVRLQALLNSL